MERLQSCAQLNKSISVRAFLTTLSAFSTTYTSQLQLKNRIARTGSTSFVSTLPFFSIAIPVVLVWFPLSRPASRAFAAYERTHFESQS